MTHWTDIHEQQRREMLEYYIEAPGLQRIAPFAERLGMNPQTLQRRLQEMNQARATPEQVRVTPLAEPEPEPPLVDDWELWSTHLERLRKKGFIWVLRFSDEHLGDEDARALAMNVEIARITKPDIILHLGDTFEFEYLSQFPKARKGLSLDAIQSVKPRYHQYQSELHAASPNSIHALLSGNHNDRARQTANAQPATGDTLERAYADLVRDNGRVLWLNWKQDVQIGGLYSEHGIFAGKNAHERLLRDRVRHASSAEQGHTHGVGLTAAVTYPPYLDHRVIVFGVMAGYGGNVPAQYQADKTDRSQYIHSCVLWGINLNGYDSHPNIIVYHERSNGELVAYVNQREIVVAA